MKYQLFTLGQLVKIRYGKDQKKVKSPLGTIPIYGTGGLMGYATESLYCKPSVLIGRKGTINKVHYVDHPFWTVDTLFYTEVNDDIVIPKYLYYLMTLSDLNHYNEGTTIPSLRTETLNRIEFNIPNLEYQKKVLSILEPIDEKIELNRAINENLELQAQAIFKNWFVDFSQSQTIEFKKSEFGEIPLDFSVVKVGSLSMLITDYVANGSFASLKENVTLYQEPNYAYFIRNTDLKSGTFGVYVDQHSYEFLSKSTLYGGEIIISNVGDVGSVFLCPKLDAPMTLGNNIIMLRPENDSLRYYLYLWFKYFQGQAIIQCIKGGSVQPKFNKTEFKRTSILLPPTELLSNFHKLVDSMFITIALNQKQNKQLADLRDTLLPRLMSGELDVSNVKLKFQSNSHLNLSNTFIIITKRSVNVFLLKHDIKNNIHIRRNDMKEELIMKVMQQMLPYLDNAQLQQLKQVMDQTLFDYEITATETKIEEDDNDKLLALFIASKKIEGCSDKTLKYYKATIHSVVTSLGKNVRHILTEDLRTYLIEYQNKSQSSRVTIDNIRRILSSFFSWLEDEDYIIKSPVRRIHKVKTASNIKETYSDEDLERMRDNCQELRDLAIIDMLASTGMRIGEMVLLNRDDINFSERECIVFGKGNKERIVYFDARAKLHLQEYLYNRHDDNPALFVSLKAPHNRINIGGIEHRLREIGKRLNIPKVHPHKFRRTLATMAIDKGMPIEQLQKLLGHQRIDTTLQYAMVKQSNVKLAHKKYIG